MEVFLGIAPAGKGSYHINISLRDAASQAPIGDASIEARVANPLGGTSRKLEAKRFNGALAYVGDFRMEGRDTYTITARIQRKGAATPAEVRFEFKP
jgi:hypothetical protein